MDVTKSKTCIVCGNPAGSKEHVFPASLGGRRKNSGIYCHTHDNSYSGLVADLGSQLDFLNAYLGVSSDHTKQKKVVIEIDSKSGHKLAISADRIKFTEPQLVSETPTDNGVEVSMNFPDMAAMKQWKKEQEDAGYSVVDRGKPTTTRYIPGSVHHERSFGGPCGLGAIAYLMQTYTAQAFSSLARSGVIKEFISYTQAIAKVSILDGRESTDGESEALVAARAALEESLEPFGGDLPIWWDFSPLKDPSPNAFAFGHRVTVGVDHIDGLIYARLSLFDTLHFAACLGHALDLTTSREVIIDIDPLAIHPPHDITERKNDSALNRVTVPTDKTQSLREAISDGTMQRRFEDLHKRIVDHQLMRLAERMEASLAPGAGMGPLDRQMLIERVVDKESQQVWRLAKHVMDGLAEAFRNGGLLPVANIVSSMIAEDGQSSGGLSQSAEICLTLAKATLVAQMQQDLDDGVLDVNRIAELMGRGTGMHMVGTALTAPLMKWAESSSDP